MTGSSSTFRPALNDHSLAILDAADQILVVAALEITTIKNVRLFLEVADQLDYERSKIRLVINRSDCVTGHPDRRRRSLDPPLHRRHDRLRRSPRRAGSESRRAVRRISSRVAARRATSSSSLEPSRARADRCPRTDKAATSADSSHAVKWKDRMPMSLLKRIERARPAAEGEATPAVPAPVPPRGRAPTPPSAAGGPATPLPSGAAARPRRPGSPGALPARESFREAKFRVQNRLINELDPKLDLSNQVEVRRQIEELFGKIADEEGLALTRAERARMLIQIATEILGYGPIQGLLHDDSVTEIMVNGPQQIYIERTGSWAPTCSRTTST